MLSLYLSLLGDACVWLMLGVGVAAGATTANGVFRFPGVLPREGPLPFKLAWPRLCACQFGAWFSLVWLIDSLGEAGMALRHESLCTTGLLVGVALVQVPLLHALLRRQEMGDKRRWSVALVAAVLGSSVALLVFWGLFALVLWLGQ